MIRISILAVAILLAGCGPKLKQIPVSSAEYRAELSKQRRLAADLRQSRAVRLDKVAGRIRAAAAQLCAPLGGETCRYPVSLQDDDAINAHADGKRVSVTGGLVRLVGNDDELAVVVGHEYAHNMLAHLDTQHGNAWIGAIFGGILDVAAAAAGVNTHGVFMRAGMRAGSAAHSQAFESEADYAGLYLAAVAGYDVSKAANFFRRFGVEQPESREYAGSHPSTPERFVAMEQVIREIEAKRLAGLPLIPEKEGGTPPDVAETKPAPPEPQSAATGTTAAPAPIPMGIPAGMSMHTP